MKKLTMALLIGLTLTNSAFGVSLSDEIKNGSLVIYNSNIGLVHEERDLRLHQPDTSIVYKGVAPSIQTDSINVEISPDLTLLSQQYRFDSLTQAKLLQTYIGKKVEVRLLRNKNEFKLISATLLAFNGDTSLVKTLDYKIITVKSDNIIFEGIPETLITEPSLVFNIKCKKDIKTTMKLDYLFSGINFKSNYILNIDKNMANLTGWITVNNKSTKSFENITLSLVTEDIEQKSFKASSLYTIPFSVNIPNNTTTQIKFLQENNISIQRVYSTTLSNPLYLKGEQTSDVNQFMVFKGLGATLLKGTMSIYSKIEGESQLLGKNSIEETPKNRDIKLKTGINFDLKVSQKNITRQDTDAWFNVGVEYTVTNVSDTNKTLEILVPFNSNQDSLLHTDQLYSLTKENLIMFSLSVEANTTKKFNVNYESKK